jgi:hypothetical protein
MPTPEAFYCAITHCIMTDPVIDPEGHSYERSAIEDWLARSSTSPVTRSALKRDDLIPNRALRESIEEYRASDDGSAAITSGELGGGEVDTAASSPPLPPSAAQPTTISVSHVVAASPAASPGVAPAGMTELHAVVTVTPPAAPAGARPGADICCVVDVSGSMGAAATLKNESGESESHGLSLLDIVKHALATIIETLEPGDRLAIVAYSTKARVVVPLNALSGSTKTLATNAVKALSSGGQTNLWDGLTTGLDLLRAAGADVAPERNASLFLLTDGLPNISPPRGEVAMLQRYLGGSAGGATSLSHVGISTFGFGYNLDSPLLAALAAEGEGAYSFIPDSTLVGTVFVHALANALAASSVRPRLRITPGVGVEGVRFATGADVVLGGHRCAAGTDDAGVAPLSVCPGQINFGQTKDVVVRLLVPTRALAVLDAYDSAALLTVSLEHVCAPAAVLQLVDSTARSAAPRDAVEAEICRLVAVDALRTATNCGLVGDLAGANAACAAAVASIEATSVAAAAKLLPAAVVVAAGVEPHSLSPAHRVRSLLLDMRGQVAEALSRPDWFKKWGAHYLRSLMQAHLLQQCNNFRDPGVQHYGSAMFVATRDAGDDIFCSLPPPVATPRPSYGRYSGAPRGAAPTARRAVSMASYHSPVGPCFEGSGRVALADGGTKRVDAIAMGDVVASPAARDGRAAVACVVRTRSAGGAARLVELPRSGLLVTPWHPVVDDASGRWTFPATIAPAMVRPCDAVYSFVLAPAESAERDASSAAAAQLPRPPSMVINATTVITLGHGIVGDDVASHEYWGTPQVVTDLAAMAGWANGLVLLEPGCVARDAMTGEACGLAQGDAEV